MKPICGRNLYIYKNGTVFLAINIAFLPVALIVMAVFIHFFTIALLWVFTCPDIAAKVVRADERYSADLIKAQCHDHFEHELKFAVFAYSGMMCSFSCIHMVVTLCTRILMKVREKKNVVNKSAMADLIDSNVLRLVHPLSNSLEYFMVKRLVENTWTHNKNAKDKHHLKQYVLKVRAVFKVVNDKLLGQYTTMKSLLEYELCDELINKPILTSSSGDVMKYKAENDAALPTDASRDVEKNESETELVTKPTDERLCAFFKTQLEDGENYLFHGTKEENLKNIVENGFNYRKFSRAGLYGKGIYLAESSEKSDAYADSFVNRRAQDLTMLVMRSALGRVQLHTEFKPINTGTPRTCDSYVSALGSFREFVLHNDDQLYPEYVVLYDRVDINSKK